MDKFITIEQLANLFKNVKVKLHNKAKCHYREMAWLPFQKTLLGIPSLFLIKKTSTVMVLGRGLHSQACFKGDKTRLAITSQIGGTGTRLLYGPIAQENPGNKRDGTGLLIISRESLE